MVKGPSARHDVLKMIRKKMGADGLVGVVGVDGGVRVDGVVGMVKLVGNH